MFCRRGPWGPTRRGAQFVPVPARTVPIQWLAAFVFRLKPRPLHGAANWTCPTKSQQEPRACMACDSLVGESIEAERMERAAIQQCLELPPQLFFGGALAAGVHRTHATRVPPSRIRSIWPALVYGTPISWTAASLMLSGHGALAGWVCKRCVRPLSGPGYSKSLGGAGVLQRALTHAQWP